MKTKTLSQILDEHYGPKGTERRDQYDAESLAFRLGVMLKESRKEAKLTQEEKVNEMWEYYKSIKE